MKIRAKMVVADVKPLEYDPNGPGRQVRLEAQYSSTPEDNSWARATPAGSINLTVDNPESAAEFEARKGKAYFVDFTPIE